MLWVSETCGSLRILVARIWKNSYNWYKTERLAADVLCVTDRSYSYCGLYLAFLSYSVMPLGYLS